MRDGPLGDSGEPMPALRRELLQPPDLARLEPSSRAEHPPRILLLYGSLRERSYSRLLVEEADRLLRVMGADTRIFDPRELPMANSTGPDHPKVQEHIWDTLSMDSAPIETEMNRGKGMGMAGFYAVDGTTVRLCAENGYEGNDEIFALQVIQGRICTSYTHEQLVYEVRNPRADVRTAGYGMAEPELFVRIITGWLNAVTCCAHWWFFRQYSQSLVLRPSRGSPRAAAPCSGSRNGSRYDARRSARHSARGAR